MLAAAVIDLLFGITLGLWLAQTSVGKALVDAVKGKVNEMTKK